MPRTRPHLAVSLMLFCLTIVLGFAIVTAGHNPLSWVDRAVLEAMVDHRSSGMTTAIAGITNLFGPLWVFLWTVLAAITFTVHDRNVRRAATILVTVAVAGMFGSALKVVFDRSRPPPVDQATAFEASHSFPSGHVTGTTALVCAIALALTLTSARVVRAIALIAALSISVLAATTRLYLGVHWFSDVLAAITLSVSVALAVPSLVGHVADRIEPRAPQSLRGYLTPTARTHRSPQHLPEGPHHAIASSD